MTDAKEIQFAIQSFEIDRFSSRTPSKTVRKDRLHFHIQHLFRTDAEAQLFSVGVRVQVSEGKQTQHELADIETITTFKLKGVAPEEFDQIPEELVVTLLSISYSNTRGALVAKTEGTIVSQVPLPLINPSKVLNHAKQP